MQCRVYMLLKVRKPLVHIVFKFVFSFFFLSVSQIGCCIVAILSPFLLYMYYVICMFSNQFKIQSLAFDSLILLGLILHLGEYFWIV
ncbi:hypothetical protein Hanom_Chr12g01083001 [Helianthus anomalus]